MYIRVEVVESGNQVCIFFDVTDYLQKVSELWRAAGGKLVAVAALQKPRRPVTRFDRIAPEDILDAPGNVWQHTPRSRTEAIELLLNIAKRARFLWMLEQ